VHVPPDSSRSASDVMQMMDNGDRIAVRYVSLRAGLVAVNDLGCVITDR
jgi:hypothetical protein